MSIKTRKDGQVVRLALRGAIVLGSESGSLRREVARALESGARRIEVNARGLRYLDAAGLGELVACRKLAKEAGASFRLRGVIGKALELLQLTGLDSSLVRHPAHGFGRHVA